MNTVTVEGLAELDELAKRCEGLTMMGKTDDGSIILGPQGWARLQDFLYLLHSERMARIGQRILGR